MAKDYKVLGDYDCPRCGAVAKLKAKQQNEWSDTLGIVIDCPKCKLNLITGFTSRQQMNRIDRHTKLLKKYKTAKTPLERGKIMKEVERMANESQDWLEGTMNS